MINPLIRIDEYNRVSDVLLYIGKNMVVKFNVQLSNYNKDTKKMEPFHKEYKYYDARVGSDRYTIHRSFGYYISIENCIANDDGIKEIVKVGVCEITLMKMMLNSGLEWFTNSEYKDLYGKRDGKLVINKQIEPKHISLQGKYVEIEPIVFVSYMGDYDFGVRLYLNSDTNYVEMPLNTYCGLQYTFESVNLYQSALGVLAYLEKPEPGSNLVSFSEGYERYSDVVRECKQPNKNKIGRKIGGNVFTKNNHLDDI